MLKIKEVGIYLADAIAGFIGSWTFIIIQSLILTVWIVLNGGRLVGYDPYPFILLNLFLSFEAAYATPLILMSSSRQADKDREHLIHDVELDQNSYALMIKMEEMLMALREDVRLDKIALANHERLKEEHQNLKEELDEIKRLLQGE
jgi:uncharacterized membrane protein